MNYPNNGFPNAAPPPGFPQPAYPAQTPAPGAQTGYPQPAPYGAPQPQFANNVPGPQYAPPMPGYPQQPVVPAMPLPASMGLDAQLQTAEEDGDRLPPLPEGGHELCEVDSTRMERGKSPETLHVITYHADCHVVRSALVPAGTRFNLRFRMVGAKYGQADEIARLRSFIAVTACGLDPADPQVKQMITEQLIIGTAQPQNPLKGKQFAIPSVTHRMTKPGFHANGSPKQVRPVGKYTFAKPGTQVFGAPVQAPVVQAAPVAQAPVWPPAGWQDVGAQYPGHWSNGQVTVTAEQLKALVAAGKA